MEYKHWRTHWGRLSPVVQQCVLNYHWELALEEERERNRYKCHETCDTYPDCPCVPDWARPQ